MGRQSEGRPRDGNVLGGWCLSADPFAIASLAALNVRESTRPIVQEPSVVFVETKRWLGGRPRNTKRILRPADDASAQVSAKNTRLLAAVRTAKCGPRDLDPANRASVPSAGRDGKDNPRESASPFESVAGA